MVIKLRIKRVNSVSSLNLEADYLSRFQISPYTYIADTTRYDRDDTNIADMTSRNMRWVLILSIPIQKTYGRHWYGYIKPCYLC